MPRATGPAAAARAATGRPHTAAGAEERGAAVEAEEAVCTGSDRLRDCRKRKRREAKRGMFMYVSCESKFKFMLDITEKNLILNIISAILKNGGRFKK